MAIGYEDVLKVLKKEQPTHIIATSMDDGSKIPYHWGNWCGVVDVAKTQNIPVTIIASPNDPVKHEVEKLNIDFVPATIEEVRKFISSL